MLASMVLNIPQQLVVAITLALQPAGDAGNTPAPAAAPAIEAAIPATRGRASRRQSAPLAFAEQAWLRIVKEEGPGRGLDEMAGRIFRTSSGRYYIPAEKDRAALLARRLEPQVEATIARLEALRNAAVIRNITGRTAYPAELYAAHLFGIESALVLIEAAETDPEVPADRLLPEAAAHMPHVLTPGGQVLTAGQLSRVLSSSFERAIHGPPVSATVAVPSVKAQNRRAPANAGRTGPRIIRITTQSKGVVRVSGAGASRAQ